MQNSSNNQINHLRQWLNLKLIVSALEAVQDLIVISLCSGEQVWRILIRVC